MMKAPLIAVLLAVICGAAFYLYQASQHAPVSGSASGAPQAQTSDRAFSLFKDVCIEGRQNFSQSENRALAAGWAVAADDVNPNIARIMSLSRGAAARVPGSVLHAYAHPGRSEYIVLTSVTVSGVPGNGCWVYDFSATGLPDTSALEAILGPPTEVQSQPGLAEIKVWNQPAALSSVAGLRVGYFVPGSAAETQLGFSGLMYAMTSLSR